MAFSWIDAWIGGRGTILISLVGLIVPGVLILLITSQMWFWILAVVIGAFVGPVQAASRSLMSRIAPESLRNQMFIVPSPPLRGARENNRCRYAAAGLVFGWS